MLIRFILLIICYAPLLTAYERVIEQSIIPLVEKAEELESLNPKKYSNAQYLHVKDALERKAAKIRLVTFNMLFNVHDDSMEDAYRWNARLDRIINVIEEMQPDLIATQELVASQLDDLVKKLGSEYGFFGKNSSDLTNNIIFYRKSRFSLLHERQVAMTAPSADLMSNALNIIELRDNRTQQAFALLNTHACFRSPDLRLEQVECIVREAGKLRHKMLPVVITGDFNSFPQRQDLTGLPFYDGDFLNDVFHAYELRDAKDKALLGHLGPLATFTNKEGDKAPFLGTGTPGIFLDHIYVSYEIVVLIHAVQPATVQGLFPSDHMPVMIDFFVEGPRMPSWTSLD